MGATAKLFLEIREQINALTEQVFEGEINPLELGRELSYTKNCIEGAKEKIAPKERDELAKYQPQELKEMKISLAGGGYTYSYKHIPEWVTKKTELEAIEEKAKTACELAMKGATVFDNGDGGEIIPAEATPRKQSISYK